MQCSGELSARGLGRSISGETPFCRVAISRSVVYSHSEKRVCAAADTEFAFSAECATLKYSERRAVVQLVCGAFLRNSRQLCVRDTLIQISAGHLWDLDLACGMNSHSGTVHLGGIA